MQAQLLKFEQQLIFLPRQAIWLGDFLEELLSVPSANHDDQVDALCQALAYAGSRGPKPIGDVGDGAFKRSHHRSVVASSFLLVLSTLR